MADLIYTLGSSTRTKEEFLRLLQHFGIRKVADVRRFPTSRFQHFQQPTAILCAERFPWKCHRRFIGVELARRGWRVVHIIDEERTWEPTAKG